MQKKSPFVHPVHSAGIYPNIPGADTAWKGKIIGFLGDRTEFANPQMVELMKNVAWAWDDPLISMDTAAMTTFYALPANREAMWSPAADVPKVRVVCPRMLALPPDCAVFCAEERRTPAELFNHITTTLGSSDIDPMHYILALDWCCAAAQGGTGADASSSLISFAMPAIMGSTDHLHEWAHNRLTITLGPRDQNRVLTPGQTDLTNSASNAGVRMGAGPIDMAMLAQVTAAVMKAIRAGGGQGTTDGDPRGMGKSTDDQKVYSEYQLAKLKGFCCMRHNSGLPTIWDYFKSTKEVDAQRTQLIEEMKRWATANKVQLNGGVYFDKATMDDIVKLDFCPGTPTAYLNTVEQGMSMLICRP
jgi:hypothetical protein